MTHNEEKTYIHVDFIQIATTGARITPDEAGSARAAQAAGLKIVRWLPPESRGSPNGPEALMDGPAGSVAICDQRDGTEIHAGNQTDDLEDLIEMIAATASAVAKEAGNPQLDDITICVAMSTDRKPPDWPIAAEMTQSRTIRTETGIRLQHSTTCRREYDIEDDCGEPAWDLIANATPQVSEMPDAHDMAVIIKATYTEACLAMMPELHGEESAPIALPIAAHEIGPYGDVAAAEIERAAEICERFDTRSAPLGAVAAIMALSGCMGNAERIRPHLDRIEYDVPSIAGPAARRIDATMAKLDEETDEVPEDDRDEPEWSDQNLNITMAVAHTMSLAAQRRAVRHCATRMRDDALPRYIRRVYRDIADRIINVSTYHLEMENEIAALHPEMARLMEEILQEAGTDAMTEFHQACQALERATNNDGGP